MITQPLVQVLLGVKQGTEDSLEPAAKVALSAKQSTNHGGTFQGDSF